MQARRFVRSNVPMIEMFRTSSPTIKLVTSPGLSGLAKGTSIIRRNTQRMMQPMASTPAILAAMSDRVWPARETKRQARNAAVSGTGLVPTPYSTASHPTTNGVPISAA